MRFAACRCLVLVCACLATLVGWSVVRAGGPTSESKVKVSARAGKADAAGKQLVTVKIIIEKGWHLYANPVKNETLEPTQTVVAVKSKNPATRAKILYPPGKLHEDKIIGSYYVYEDVVDIQAEVQRADGDGPLDVEVKLNACTDKRCLRGSTIKLQVP